MIKLIKGNIVDLDVDAIVNAANSSLLGGGGVDGAIHKAAGYRLKEACRAFGGCDTGEAVITSGFDLKAKYVIHTVGPIYFEHDEEENKELLSNCYINSLNIAKSNNIHSIAFPCISSGAYGYPIDESSLVAITSVRKWLKQNDYDIDVYFFCYEEYDYEVYLNRIPEIDDKLSKDIDEYLKLNYKQRKPRKKHTSVNLNSVISGSSIKEEIVMPESSIDNTVCYSCSCSLDDALKEIDESFSEMILRKIDEKGIKDSECYKKANIDRRLFSKIRSDKHYRPSKETALALAISLELPLKEVEELLRKAGLAFSGSSKFDVIVKYFIENKKYDISLIDEALLKYDQKTITNYYNC